MSEYSEDRDLVRQLLAGNEDAFDAFFREQAPRLYRFAITRLSGSADAAEEVVQTTLIRAIDKLATYRGQAALSTWLITFCRHEISAWWRRSRCGSPLAVLGGICDLEDVADRVSSLPADDSEHRFLTEELGTLVRTILDDLPENHSKALELKYMTGLSVREIGERLDIGPTAAQSLLSRAREGFRRHFRRSCQDLVPRAERRNV